MELKPEAFSPQGYLIAQHRTGELRFGAFGNDKNGCGWIAAYNLLKACLFPVSWQQVHGELSRRLLFRGRFGVHLVVLLGYLAEKGLRLRFALSLTGARLLAKRYRCGILLYGTGQSTHYVTWLNQGEGQLQFLNVAPGQEELTMSLREFYERIVDFPLFFFIAVA